MAMFWPDPLSNMAENFDPLSSRDSNKSVTKKRSPKGSVVVHSQDGRIRLRWTARDAQGQRKRFSLTFGADHEVNRLAARNLALRIQNDILFGIFDPTLSAYAPEVDSFNKLDVSDLFDRYIDRSLNEDQTSSLERYKTLKTHLQKCFGGISVDGLNDKKARKFLDYLQAVPCNGETCNVYLTFLRAVWRWAITRGWVQFNPWDGLRVEVEASLPPDPFNRVEIERIIAGFEGDYYQPFVRFLFGSGCRIGEAIALDWQAVSEDCSEIWIGRSWDAKGRKLKNTKTNKVRTVPIGPGIQSMLQGLREQGGTGLVFPSPKGMFIDRQNFLKRHWKPVLTRLEIPYRTPYNSRHTRWSHEIANGMDIAVASRYAGNTPRTMLDRYYGATERPRLMDF